jgi:hypothetical protein
MERALSLSDENIESADNAYLLAGPHPGPAAEIS